MVTFEVTEGTYHDLVLGLVPLVLELEALVILKLIDHGFVSLVPMFLKDGHGGQALEVGDDAHVPHVCLHGICNGRDHHTVSWPQIGHWLQ